MKKSFFVFLLIVVIIADFVFPVSAVSLSYHNKNELSIKNLSSSEQLVYDDDVANVHFTVPNGWQRQPMNAERRFLDVKFKRIGGSTDTFLFGAYDLWSDMPSEERQFLNRSDINDSFIDEKMIQSMIDVLPVAIVDEYIAGTHYYKVEWKESIDVEGSYIDASMTALLHIQNGWLYFFEFGGVQRDSYKTDMQELMKSVKYNSKKGQLVDVKNLLSYPICILIVLIVFGIIVCFIMIKKIGSKNRERKKYEEKMDGFICPVCMAIIPVESIFCPVCGKQIDKGDKQ